MHRKNLYKQNNVIAIEYNVIIVAQNIVYANLSHFVFSVVLLLRPVVKLAYGSK